MNLARRSILKAIGLSPLAAKVAADKASSELIGIAQAGGYGAPVASGIISPAALPPSQVDWKTKVIQFVSSGKLPDWFYQDVRERNRTVNYLDPDIACKKSWSLNVKIVTQRERNIERATKEAIEGPRRGLRQRDFEEKFGVWI